MTHLGPLTSTTSDRLARAVAIGLVCISLVTMGPIAAALDDSVGHPSSSAHHHHHNAPGDETIAPVEGMHGFAPDCATCESINRTAPSTLAERATLSPEPVIVATEIGRSLPARFSLPSSAPSRAPPAIRS